MTKITDLIIDKFRFLQTDFGCNVIDRKNKDGFASVLYKNVHCALSVAIEMEFRDVFANFYKLDRKGGIPNFPPSYGFSLDDLVYVKTGDYPRAKGVLKEFTSAEIVPILELEAASMKKFGCDVLGGDFSTYPRILKVMNVRVKKLSDPLKKKYPEFFKR